MTRSRDFSLPTNQGTISWNGTVTKTVSCSMSYGHMDDTTSPAYPLYQGNNPMTSSKVQVTYEPMNGEYNLLGLPRVYTQAVPNWCRNSITVSHAAMTGAPRRNIAATVAGTNPSRPSVDVPVFLAELRDLPDMIREVWQWAASVASSAGYRNLKTLGIAIAAQRRHFNNDNLPHTASSLELAYDFGWRPLVQDLLGMATLTATVQKRALEIQQHKNRGGLRYYRRLGQESGTSSFTAGSDLESNINAQKSSVKDYWLTCRWVPVRSMPPSLPFPESGRLAAAVYGLDVNFASAYKAFPWSWLLDWCTHLGDIISLQHNLLGYNLERVSYMEHARTQTNYVVKSNKGSVQGGGGSSVYTTSSRAPITDVGLLIASVPFLGEHQLSLLASLLISRKKYAR